MSECTPACSTGKAPQDGGRTETDRGSQKLQPCLGHGKVLGGRRSWSAGSGHIWEPGWGSRASCSPQPIPHCMHGQQGTAPRREYEGVRIRWQSPQRSSAGEDTRTPCDLHSGIMRLRGPQRPAVEKGAVRACAHPRCSRSALRPPLGCYGPAADCWRPMLAGDPTPRPVCSFLLEVASGLPCPGPESWKFIVRKLFKTLPRSLRPVPGAERHRGWMNDPPTTPKTQMGRGALWPVS